jgi:hypothetical protein
MSIHIPPYFGVILGPTILSCQAGEIFRKADENKMWIGPGRFLFWLRNVNEKAIFAACDGRRQ